MDGVPLVVAGGPRGVFLWGRGNSGIDVPSVLLLAGWNGLCARFARTTVVKVRRTGRFRARHHVLTRRFPATTDLDRLLDEVETELRAKRP